MGLSRIHISSAYYRISSPEYEPAYKWTCVIWIHWVSETSHCDDYNQMKVLSHILVSEFHDDFAAES